MNPMKRVLSFFLCVLLVGTLAACGGAAPEPEIGEWTRAGYYQDDEGNMLSVTLMEDVVEPGWYVGVMIGETMAGWTIPQEGNALHGNLNGGDESAEPFVVTLSEEGEDGLLLVVEGGETYHFKPMELPEATIVVYINTEGWGNIAYAEGENTPEIDPEYPTQSAYIGLAEPETYTFAAWPQAGNLFVKWTKNGEDISTEPQITVLLDESAEYIAVFEEDPGWQNPVMNFVGNYQCDRARALVECAGNEDAFITIDWGSSAWELTRWLIYGRLDTETLTIDYAGCSKTLLVYDENGEIKSQESEYEDGTGTIAFHEDGTFTWHEDQSEYGRDMVFEWVPVTEDPDYYSFVTAMEKSEVEDFCLTVRNAFLDEDWEALAGVIRYPIEINGIELKTAEDFLAFMKDKTVAQGDRDAMAEETCHDMFFNGQGICFGSGEIWVIDPHYMTDEAPVLQIIAFNGIVER